FDSSEISESVNFCVMEAIKLCRLDTPIIFIEARINLSRFVVTGCAAKTSATVTFPSLNLISLFAFCFNKIGRASCRERVSYWGVAGRWQRQRPINTPRITRLGYNAHS